MKKKNEISIHENKQTNKELLFSEIKERKNEKWNVTRKEEYSKKVETDKTRIIMYRCVESYLSAIFWFV